jgi:hypothetical protein
MGTEISTEELTNREPKAGQAYYRENAEQESNKNTSQEL